jgi:uncharacterized RDD family membrane protein YckC
VAPGFRYCPACGTEVVSLVATVATSAAPPALAHGTWWPTAHHAHSAHGQAGPHSPDRLTIWWEGHRFGHGPHDSLAPATLLTWRPAGGLRLVAASLIDWTLFWTLSVMGLFAPVLGELVVLALLFINFYLEGSTGQSFGKKVLGIYVIKHDTGEFLGGMAGIGRRLLHAVDYVLFIGFIVGLFNTRTFADLIVGSTVVVRPPAGQFPAPAPYPVPSPDHAPELQPAQDTIPQPQPSEPSEPEVVTALSSSAPPSRPTRSRKATNGTKVMDT